MSRSLGSVRKRRNRWELRWSAPDPITGQPVRRSKLVIAENQREATRKLHAILDALPTSAITVEALCRRWIEHSAPNKAERTVEENERQVRLHIAPAIGHLKARDVTARQLNELYRSMLAKGKSNQTVRHVHNVLSASFKLGINEDWLTSNPAARAEPPAVHADPIEVPLSSEVRAVMGSLHPQMQRFVFLAVDTSARRGELAGLRWRDVNFAQATITINQAATAPKGGVTTKTPKGRKARRVVISDASLLLLQEQYRYHQAAGHAGAPDCYVFASPDTERGDRPMHPHTFTQAWRKARKAAELDGIRLHDLRHFAASVLLERGARIHDVQERLGHAKPSTTLNIYGHLMVDAGREHSGWLAAELSGENVSDGVDNG